MGFILSGHNIDEGLSPIYKRSEGLTFNFSMVNSVGAGTIALGTFNFPMQLAAHPGVIALEMRDDNGDTVIWSEEWSNPVAPPYRVQNGNVISGDLFNAGSSVFRSYVKSCVNLGNSSRIEFPAGVGGTFENVVLCQFRNSDSPTENICPAVQDDTALIEEFIITINLTVSG